ncbi:type IV pilus biogenesis protein PilM [Virgibacillus sp. DJP39]|uniref:type IV pilus biogenesis protein PilM n=1 Tax=Virgibacillus sp. DJP39 TaxID=3409790 RepID=UPI003BB65C0D
MALVKSGRVNIVITNRVLRYSYHKNASLDSLITYGELELPEGTIIDGKIGNKAVLKELVEQLVQSQKWKRKKLFFCVPDDTVVIRELSVPSALQPNEIKGYIKTQIGNSFHLPFDNPAIDFELLDGGEQQKILLFAYPNDKLEPFISLFTQAGLRPEAADFTSLSIYRYYYSKEHAKDNDVLLVNWNKDSIVITAFNQHKAIFTRYRKLDFPVEIVDEIVADRLIADQIIEINRIIDFYQYNITNGSSSISRLIIGGDFPFLQQVKTELLSRVSIAVDLVDEIDKTHDTPAKYIDVLGLALKEVT